MGPNTATCNPTSTINITQPTATATATATTPTTARQPAAAAAAAAAAAVVAAAAGGTERAQTNSNSSSNSSSCNSGTCSCNTSVAAAAQADQKFVNYPSKLRSFSTPLFNRAEQLGATPHCIPSLSGLGFGLPLRGNLHRSGSLGRGPGTAKGLSQPLSRPTLEPG